MRRTAFILKNEEGYFLILATLMIMVLLTILGISAARTSMTELAAAANEVLYQRNFYRAEGAAMEAVDRLANATALEDNFPSWLDMHAGSLNEGNVIDYWDGKDLGWGTVKAAPAVILDPTGDTRYIAGVEYIALGSSLDMDKPKAFAIAVYGLCRTQGNTLIKVGYRKTF